MWTRSTGTRQSSTWSTSPEKHDARELRRLGAHLLEVVDPDGADAQLAAQLEAQERDAARKTFLTVRDCGDGTHEGRFKIPTLHAAMLTRQLEALMNPGRPDPITTTTINADGDGKTRPEVRGEAFTQWISRYPTDRLPTSGGVAATVVVTIPLDTLLHGLQAAALDTGDLISPTLARRLACEAGIIPAVLGSHGEVLDLGRKTRFHTPKQRLAMNLQQHGTCAVERCTMPATWADAHHLTPWSQGGHTSVHDGVLTCTRHHTQAHDPRYQSNASDPARSDWFDGNRSLPPSPGWSRRTARCASPARPARVAKLPQSPGHSPVHRWKARAPPRSTAALTTAKTAPCAAAARRISLIEYSDSSALGASGLSPGVARFQTCLKTWLAMTPPMMPLVIPNGR